MNKIKLLRRTLLPILIMLIGSWAMLPAQSSDNAQFNFENGQMCGFYGGNPAPVLSSDTTRAFAGNGSLKVTCSASGTYEVQIDLPGQIAAGTPIDFHVYVPSDMTASLQR